MVGRWQSLKSGWYAFIVPGIIFLRHLLWSPHPNRSRCNSRRRDNLDGFHSAHASFADFPAMLVSSAKVNGVILPIIAFSVPLAEALAIMGVLKGL